MYSILKICGNYKESTINLFLGISAKFWVFYLFFSIRKKEYGHQWIRLSVQCMWDCYFGI